MSNMSLSSAKSPTLKQSNLLLCLFKLFLDLVFEVLFLDRGEAVSILLYKMSSDSDGIKN